MIKNKDRELLLAYLGVKSSLLTSESQPIFSKGMRSQYKTFHLLRERFYYQASSCFGCKIALFFQKSLGMPSFRILKVTPVGPGCRCFSDTWRRRTQPCIYIYSSAHFRENPGMARKKIFSQHFFLFSWEAFLLGRCRKVGPCAHQYVPRATGSDIFQVWLFWLLHFQMAMLQKKWYGEIFWRCIFWHALSG